MIKEIFDDQFLKTVQNAFTPGDKGVMINGELKSVRYPFPSPDDWRDCWMYFLMTDRFNNPDTPPKSTWNQVYDYRQGGTFNGIREQLDYIKSLGAGAIWISPILKNSRPELQYNYHGYGIQDFLSLDERFASDGTSETAEKEFTALVDEAHARGIYIVIDIVLNHSAEVFDYKYNDEVVSTFTDSAVMNSPLGQEPDIEWLNGLGKPREDWTNNIPQGTYLSPDDAVYPTDLQIKEFFRRRGNVLNYDVSPSKGDFIRGDFGDMRQLVLEYDAQPESQKSIRDKYGVSPVLDILINCYKYMIAKYDIDGFRIDTVKYVCPSAIQTFGNAMREFALSIGKKNFFTFGEIYDNENVIDDFIGRNSDSSDPEDNGFGIDAALDYPLFYQLPNVAKALNNVENIRNMFENRKNAQKNLISSHGEAGKFFVSFLDNHDQSQRINFPGTDQKQVVLALAGLFGLQGIPCLYYGTEQGLQGCNDSDGNHIYSMESIREALWGKEYPAFDQNNSLYKQIQALSNLRMNEPALRYGRLYFRQVSGNNIDFGHSKGPGGILAFSRILADREILILANTSYHNSFSGSVLVDVDLNRNQSNMIYSYGNMAQPGSNQNPNIRIINQANLYDDYGNITYSGEITAIDVNLNPMEVQIFNGGAAAMMNNYISQFASSSENQY